MAIKYYIGSQNGSGIETKDFNNFVSCLKKMSKQAEKLGCDYFEVTVETIVTE